VTTVSARDQHRWQAALERDPNGETWRGLDELADPPDPPDPLDPLAQSGSDPEQHAAGLSRREFFRLTGTTFALAGAAGCVQQPAEAIYPYNDHPEEVVPGRPLHYATSMVVDGYATGLLVESHAGRPTKVEGNPEHPASLGATSAMQQAWVLGLYNPHRARELRSGGGAAARTRSWDRFAGEFAAARSDQGAGLRFVLEPTTSPCIGGLLEQIRQRFPMVRFALHSPAQGNELPGAELACGQPVQPIYDFEAADIVVALDADFAARGPMHLRYAAQFAQRRNAGIAGARPPSRLYQVEPAFSPTGMIADVRLRSQAREVAAVADALYAVLSGGSLPALPAQSTAWVQAAARDLLAHRGRSLVIAGSEQPPPVHAAAHAINRALANQRTAWMVPSPFVDLGEHRIAMVDLVAEMSAGAVDTVVVLDCNPVYSTPAELGFAAAYARVPRRVCLSGFADETALASTWLVPAAHPLESWGDARAADGTLSPIQPLLEPLFDGRTVAELLAVFAGNPRPQVRQLLLDSWRPLFSDDYDRAVARSLQRGLVAGSAFAPVYPPLLWQKTAATAGGDAIELSLRPSPAVHDGRFADNGWLQEMPHPVTKLTWDNAAMLSPRTAIRLGVDTGDMLELQRAGHTLRAPVLVAPGHADESVTLELGYGRRGAEATARGVGVDAYQLRPADEAMIASVQVRKVPGRHELALTQTHWRIPDSRTLAPRATLASYRSHPDFTAALRGPLPSLLPEPTRQGLQWAMTIDTGVCTGCSACVIACVAENNTPVVGKQQVSLSREMHWLRIDRYFSGPVDDPDVVNQPMMCQHCELAPCEYVCPVNATSHSPDGLNEMTYNRCIGTRFCSNNCPYKVRRFNWFDFVDRGLVRLQKNPEVTVRERGVMEKCTYCVQRIRRAEIDARIAGTALCQGDVQTACQQACPTGAILFGSLSHPDSPMVRRRDEPRGYFVLHDLGTRPRAKYLAKIVNPGQGSAADVPAEGH
jgi:Fe-S-cluster-containing dehydrogenase component